MQVLTQTVQAMEALRQSPWDMSGVRRTQDPELAVSAI